MRPKISADAKGYFCTELRKFKTEKHLSQEEMAHILFISPRSYSDLENGKSFCSAFTLLRLFQLFGDAYPKILERLLSYVPNDNATNL